MADELKPGRERLLKMIQEGSLLDTMADIAYWLEDLELRLRAVEARMPPPRRRGRGGWLTRLRSGTRVRPSTARGERGRSMTMTYSPRVSKEIR